MELTIDQALQKAVESHLAGKIQEAESLYRAILQAQPQHPDANHNLGVMAVSLNKTAVALPLFMIALEANPNQGQFWLSYIDALIKEKQFENARNLLQQGKKRGLTGDMVDELEVRLKASLLLKSSETLTNKTVIFTNQLKKASAKKEKKKNTSLNKSNLIHARNPSHLELNALLDHYQKGRNDLAENLAKEITQKYPDHHFGWKMLGAVFKKTGRLQDSLNASERALGMSPNDAEAHANLGNTLKELGRLEDAETSYKKAIAIKPTYAEANNNLGATLQELGRLEEAEKSYKKAIAIYPDFAEAHGNLGNILQELGRLEEAEASYNKAIAIKPGFAEAYSNLGNTLKELGRLADAEASYAKAIRLKPDFIKAHNEMLTCLYLMDKKPLFFEQLDYLITQNKPNSVAGSLTGRSALKYGEERPNIFCNEPLKHALLVDLKNRYNFEEIFIQNVKSILNENNRSNRRQTLLSNGYQTLGNLFDIENNFVDEIQKVIRSEIERYRTYFKSSEEGLIRKWPNEYTLYGWLICMKSGGELKPHIHENGWLSGSIYINAPPKTNVDSGSLVVALGKDSDATNSRQNLRKIIDVFTGSMVLFPASLMHHTIPFESEEERIVLAFDVIPKFP